ncbi:phosphomevalonate kinase [Kwoniella shivajii]|uniref:Phosphomevalonate kinase n=1 Tax=Kwoniella shivajii TaxID=564305 RepID=A0ABZ1DC61_9TREE|nr:phosphomevalonate kinase [Kwoniella shivajii]
MEPERTTISSPGKVLLAGGYLVLDRAFSGVVVATSSRFYSTVTSLPSPSTSSSSGKAIISVRAGQFPAKSSTWTYSLLLEKEALRLEQNKEDGGKNKFIYLALFQSLTLAYETLAKTGHNRGQEAAEELINRLTAHGEGLDIVVLADNDFYSQREQLSALSLPTKITSLSSLPPFTHLPRPISQTNKTGLGSSAALVTSLVASLLVHLKILDLSHKEANPDKLEKSDDLETLHSLAQFVHCLAQGKVGSGFDISSAVFGTHIYRRFSPSLLTSLMDRPIDAIPLELSEEDTLMDGLAPSQWDQDVTSFRLPKGLRLILADVDAGTDTPSFVGKVLSWRKENPQQAGNVWAELNEANMQLEQSLTGLVNREGDNGYEKTLESMGDKHIEDNKSNAMMAALLYEIRQTLFTIRSLLRKMSELSGVPIEPPEQTRLLDACSELPGVIGGGVPGAGGYDALYLLVIDTPSVASRVDDLWSGWKEMSVCPLLARQSDEGLRIEKLDQVRGLKEALKR